jgi:hypothetical protein
VFDVVGYAMDLHDTDLHDGTGGGDGTHVARCWNSIVFPRRDA